MTTINPEPLAFGSTVQRFYRIYNHPKLDPDGLFIARPPGCDPCIYSPKPVYLAYRRKKANQKDPWRYKMELEKWAKNLGYRNQRVLEERRWNATLLGPAWTEVHELPKCEAACGNVGFGRTKRFKKYDPNLPGPGTYYSDGPYRVPNGPHSKRPTFLREEPCRFKDTVPSWSLAPNRYTIVDKDDIAHLSKRVVSLKGPYRLFTGKRDGSTIKNHFATSDKAMATSWPWSLPGCLEGLKKKHFGEWNKTNMSVPPRNRMAVSNLANWPRKPDDPGAAAYLPEPLEAEFKQNMYGFNMSYDKPPGYCRKGVWPGVGRYSLRDRPAIAGHGHRHVFLSKIQRTIGTVLPEKMNTF